MNEFEVVLAYKLLVITVGCLITFFGYHLILVGATKHTPTKKPSSIETNYREFRLVLKSTAPGIFFALFGTSVILMTVVKGLRFEDR